MAMKAGVRVVRGPDWNSKRQDSGEGYLGTMVYVPKPGSNDHLVTILWDSGRELRYRAGKDGKYDLRALDTAPSGIVHKFITCDSCRESPVNGLRWKCSDCDDFNLCTACYMKNKHDTSHRFLRIYQENTPAIGVPPRKKSRCIQSRGIFQNSKVMRGPHWKWKNEDGGLDEVGEVKRIVEWKGVSHGAMQVYWPTTNHTGDYRLGAEGCVDLIFISERDGGEYYPDHLPIVDVVSPGTVCLVNGDKVQVALNMVQLRQLQDNVIYGGWEEHGRMKQCIDEQGTVVSLLYNGKAARVQYEDAKIWTINRHALTRMHSFKVSEAVRILDNFNAVKELQEGHGGWNDNMKGTLGKNGRIVCKEKDGDFRVKIGSRTWNFSPVCVMQLDNPEVASQVPALTTEDMESEDEDLLDSSSLESSSFNAIADAVAVFMTEMMRPKLGMDTDVNIVQVAAQGDLNAVKDIIKASPGKINQQVEKKTALQLASYEGYTDVVEFLLKQKADTSLVDDEGDTALHFAAFGNEPEIIKMLLSQGVKIDAQNKKKQTALHICVVKGCASCTKHLIANGCSVTIKDEDGDTSMHDAIVVKEKDGDASMDDPIVAKDEQQDIVRTVLTAKGADFKVENGKKFSVFCWAALKDNRIALDIMIDKKMDVDVKMTGEGFTALHVAAANDHIEIASALITKGKCNVNEKDNTGRSALHIAVSQGHKRTVELLTNSGCDVNCQDDLGNTPLHVAQMSKSLQDGVAKLLGVKKQKDIEIQITYYLVENKADIMMKNNAGKTPIDLASDNNTRDFLKMMAKVSKTKLNTTQGGVNIPLNWDDMKKQTMLKVNLSPGSGMTSVEYKDVSQLFQNSMSQCNIISICRVQHPFLWEYYYIKRKQMEHEYGVGCANEQRLFHGTCPEVVDNICNGNFDFRLAGVRVGTLFGKGAYFAIQAKYSDGYAKPDTNSHKFMFLAKVLAGKTALGDPSYSRPPPIDITDPMSKLYDSCVNNTSSPSLYCVFDTNQCYPEYIIEYI